MKKENRYVVPKARSALLITVIVAGCMGPDRLSTVQSSEQFKRGRDLYMVSCAACHHANGQGIDDLAPPVVGSPWVLGSEQRLIRIVLHGVRGPISVGGAEFNLEMPSMAFFDDDEIAAILTFARSAWGNRAEPVAAKTVRDIRASTQSRRDSWVVDELRAIQ